MGIEDENKLYGQEDDRERVNSTQKQDLAVGETGDPRDPNSDAYIPRILMKQGTNMGFEDCDFDRKNFGYYVFHEDPTKPGRIERAKAAYWEHVTNRTGQVAQRSAGGGICYLMRLPAKYRQEDLDAKKKRVQATMADQGKIGPGEYAPDPKTGQGEGGTSIHQSSHTSDNPFA